MFVSFMFLLVPENDDNRMEAQDTPVISVESNRNNETEIPEPVKPRKAAKLPKSSSTRIIDSTLTNIVTAAPANGGEGVTVEASASPSGKMPFFFCFFRISLYSYFLNWLGCLFFLGEGCSDKFKNCHLVVQARLCKLKYYLVSCCASCSKPKTWMAPIDSNTGFGIRQNKK